MDNKTIADGLKVIHNGILSSDWQLVCEGWTSITGIDVEPPKSSKSKNKENSSSDLQSLRDMLKSLLDDKKQTPKPREMKHKLKTKKQSGGERFGKGKITIISDEFDEDEAQQNKAVAENTEKTKRPSFDGKDRFEKFKDPSGPFTLKDTFQKTERR